MRSVRSVLLVLVVVALSVCALPPAGAHGSNEVRGATVPGFRGIADVRSVIDVGELATRTRMKGSPERFLAPAPGRGPSDVSVRPDASTDPESRVSATPAEASPVASPSFEALGDNGTTIPPDTNGAVGPTHVMTALNSQVRIQDRTGNTISTVSLATFWASVNPIGRKGAETFDPRLVFDPYGTGNGDGRFVFTTLTDPESAASALLIGVSQTSDPTGQWNLYRIDADATNQLWADFPSVGFNKNWIVVQVNIFRGNNEDTFVRGDVYAFDKLNLYAGGQASGTFTRFPDSQTFSDAPTVTYDPVQETEYLVEELDGNSQGKGILRMSSITGTPGAPVFNVHVALPSVTSPWADVPNPQGTDFAPQQGTTKKIQVNDSNILGCVYRNGSIWCAHTIFLPVSSPTHSAIQWWQLAADGTIQQRVRIDDPTAQEFYAFPSITVNAQSDVLVGFSSYSASQYASAAYAFQAGTDPRGSMRDVTILKAGEAPYFKTFGGSLNRWGDFSATGVDPVNDLDMWTLQEYADSPNSPCGQNCWATWWGRISPPPSQPDPGTLQLNSSSFTVNEDAGSATITVTRTGGSAGQVSVDYATSPGTATPGVDYEDVSGTLTFGDGVVTGTFAVPIVDDAAREPYETVHVALSNVQGATLGSQASATLTIVDDDVARFRPDLLIKTSFGPYAGDDVYTTTGRHQTKSASAARGSTRTFFFTVENDGASSDRIRISAPGDSAGFKVRYSEGGASLSNRDGSLRAVVPSLAPGRRISVPVKIVVTVLDSAVRGRTKTIAITATSTHGPKDVAKAKVRVV